MIYCDVSSLFYYSCRPWIVFYLVKILDSFVKKLRHAIIPRISRTKYSRIDQVKFFKGCLPQILLGSLLNTLSQILKRVSTRITLTRVSRGIFSIWKMECLTVDNLPLYILTDRDPADDKQD